MAYEGIEVEIKLKVNEASARALKIRLEKGGAAETHQVDTYFDNRHDSFLNFSPLREWLSVRRRGDRALINHKLFHFGNDGHATHCDEVDLPVDSAEMATKLLEALGFEKLITVDKRRIEGSLGKNYLVSVDEVLGLGHFVEIEATQNLGSVNATRSALRDFAVEDLGLSLDVIDHKGYPHLLIEKRAAEQPA
jgi:predicted adenylyl cyclase CyaB